MEMHTLPSFNRHILYLHSAIHTSLIFLLGGSMHFSPQPHRKVPIHPACLPLAPIVSMPSPLDHRLSKSRHLGFEALKCTIVIPTTKANYLPYCQMNQMKMSDAAQPWTFELNTDAPQTTTTGEEHKRSYLLY